MINSASSVSCFIQPLRTFFAYLCDCIIGPWTVVLISLLG